MLDFVISNYIIFIVIGVVLLLGLFGYIIDKKKYQEYKSEIIKNDSITITDTPPIIDNGVIDNSLQPTNNDNQINIKEE